MGSGQSRKPRSSRTRASGRYDLRAGSPGNDLHEKTGGEYRRTASENLNNVRRVKLPDSVVKSLSKTSAPADHDNDDLAKPGVDNTADGKVQHATQQGNNNGSGFLHKITNSQRKPKRVAKSVSEDASKFTAAKSRHNQLHQQQQQRDNVKGQKRLRHTVHASDRIATAEQARNSDMACVLALGGLRSTLVDLAPYASAFVVVPLNLEHQDAVGDLLKHALNLAVPASDALMPNSKKNWIQLSGHPGSLIPAGTSRVWKRQTPGDCGEEMLYPHLMSDGIRTLVPQFFGRVVQNGETFIELEDLLCDFVNPSIMDIKMGTRTFAETEVENMLPRQDLYDKMIRIDPNEPTAEEHEQKAITKMRYMQFRERESSTATLGFRIDALRVAGEEPKRDLQTIRTHSAISLLMKNFFRNDPQLIQKLVDRLREMQTVLLQSRFFSCHEIIGSSILIVVDRTRVGAWMIDFAKTTTHIDSAPLTHRAEWRPGNHEDGYLTGLDNLLEILTQKEDAANTTPCPDG